MYKYNGWFPIVRCVCGREVLLRRATVCECGVTLRAARRGNVINLRGTGPDNYDLAGQPYREIRCIRWVMNDGRSEEVDKRAYEN